jgi:hypothetical protein
MPYRSRSWLIFLPKKPPQCQSRRYRTPSLSRLCPRVFAPSLSRLFTRVFAPSLSRLFTRVFAPECLPSIPAALSALHQGDGVLPPAEHSPVPVISVCPHQPDGQDPSAPSACPLPRSSESSTGTSPSVEPSFRQVSTNRDFAGPPLSPSSCAPVDTTSFVNRRLSPRAPEWSPAPGVSPKEELQLLIARSTHQLQSSTSW